MTRKRGSELQKRLTNLKNLYEWGDISEDEYQERILEAHQKLPDSYINPGEERARL